MSLELANEIRRKGNAPPRARCLGRLKRPSTTFPVSHENALYGSGPFFQIQIAPHKGEVFFGPHSRDKGEFK
jgi:hypothetical protein